MRRGPVIRCLISGALATLIFLHSHIVFADTLISRAGTGTSFTTTPTTHYSGYFLVSSSTIAAGTGYGTALATDWGLGILPTGKHYYSQIPTPTNTTLGCSDLGLVLYKANGFTGLIAANTANGILNGGNCDFDSTIVDQGGFPNILSLILIFDAKNTNGTAVPFTLDGDSDPSFGVFDYWTGVFIQHGTPKLLISDTPFATTTRYCTPGVDSNCNDNVMFLPGIEGSRLYEVGRGRVWESDDSGAVELLMNHDGSSQNSNIFTKDLINKISLTGGTFANVYQPLIDSMNALKSNGIIADWEAVPYDWRLSLDQIVSSGRLLNSDESISYTSATSSPYIIQELKRLSASSRTGKVTIIAHSNGGLVTKKLIESLGADSSKYIDKIIFVAVPSLGTPQAVEGILSGEEEAVPSHLAASVARYLAQNMPMSYNLLPSNKYFTYVDDPVVSFDPSTMQDWISKYGTSVIHSTDRLSAFMLDTSHIGPSLVDPDLETPASANPTLFSFATNVHADLDNWTPPKGIELFTIAGWGNETVSGITYKRIPETVCLGTDANGSCVGYQQISTKLTFVPDHVVNGDGTVVEPSALWAGGGSSTKYFINLNSYNADHDNVRLPLINELLHTDHGRIFKVEELNQLLINIIKDSSAVEIPTKYISITEPTSTAMNRLHFVLHSPLTLGFLDSLGNYTGSTATSTISNIPDVQFERYGDVQWLSVPKTLAGQVVMHGTGSGSFTLDIEDVNGNYTLATTTFAAIPSSTSTVATLGVNPAQSLTSNGTLIVDFNGDGLSDQTFHAKQGYTVSPFFYRFDGFMQPINDTAHNVGDSVSVFKAGSTVPVKLQLKDLAGKVVQASSLPVWTTPQRGSTMNAAVDETLYTDPASTGSSFKYDSTSQTYSYNWSTKGLAAGYWYKISVKLDDGSTQSVVIGLK